MSEVENFDDHIRKEFESFSPNVSPRIWERIIAERERRRPAGFWFSLFSNKNNLWIAGLIITGMIGFGLYELRSGKTNETNSTLVTISNLDKNVSSITANENNNSTTATSSTNKKGASQLTDRNAGSTIEKNKLLNSTAERKETSADKASSALDNDLVKEENDIKRKIATTSNKELNKTNDVTGADKDLSDHVIEEPVSSLSIPKDKTSLISSISNSDRRSRKNKFYYKNNKGNSIVTNGSEDVMANNDEDISTSNDRQAAQTKTIQLLSLPSLAPLITIGRSSSNSSTDLSLKQRFSPNINLPECPTIEKDAAGNKRYLEVYLGPDYDIRSLSDTANSVYLQKREASSQFTFGYSGGIRYTKVFNNGMSVRAALNYSQINETFTFIQGNISQVTYIIDPNTGDTTNSYTVTGSRYRTTYNSYRSIDIPLTIGYELGNGKIHANINAGVVANIYSWQKGDILDTNYKPVDITTGKGSSYYQFKSNVGLGVTGGASIYYKWNDIVHFLVEPYIRYNFQSMGSENLTLRQKYTTIGLRLGLRFDLP